MNRDMRLEVRCRRLAAFIGHLPLIWSLIRDIVQCVWWSGQPGDGTGDILVTLRPFANLAVGQSNPEYRMRARTAHVSQRRNVLFKRGVAVGGRDGASVILAFSDDLLERVTEPQPDETDLMGASVVVCGESLAGAAA